MKPFDEDFGNDPFEEIVREFFGGSRRRSNGNVFIKSESDERQTDFIDDGENIYLIFELPGFNEGDVSLSIKNHNLDIVIGKKERLCEIEKVQNYLVEKLCKESVISKNIPKFIDTKNFKHSMRNGILEITFSKK